MCDGHQSCVQFKVAGAVFGEVGGCVALLCAMSCATGINYESHFTWQGQYLVMLECDFLWQAQHVVTFG